MPTTHSPAALTVGVGLYIQWINFEYTENIFKLKFTYILNIFTAVCNDDGTLWLFLIIFNINNLVKIWIASPNKHQPFVILPAALSMGYRKISHDVKIATVRLYECGLLELNDILDCCGFSHRTWYRVLKLWRETGDVIPEAQSLWGHVQTLDWEDISYLLELIRDNPDYFLDELLSLLETNCFISVHYTIFCELKQLNVSQKKLKRIALERDKERRADYICTHGTVLSRGGRIPRWNVQGCPLCWKALQKVSKKHMCSKEAGLCSWAAYINRSSPHTWRHCCRDCSWGVNDKRAFPWVSWVQCREFLLRYILYSSWFHPHQLPKCSAYPGPLIVLVMDNARIHYGDEILELADQFGKKSEKIWCQ